MSKRKLSFFKTEDDNEKGVLDPLLEYGECPICYNTILTDIFQCKNGHIICGDCKVKCTCCPSCRDYSLNNRNLVLETLLNDKEITCPHENCTFFDKLFAVKKHVVVCDHRKTNCFIRDCKEKVDINNLIDHMLTEHNCQIHDIHSPSKSIIKRFSIGSDPARKHLYWNPTVIITSKNSYLWSLECVGSNLISFVTCIKLRSENTEGITYGLEFKNDDTSICFKSKMTPVTSWTDTNDDSYISDKCIMNRKLLERMNKTDEIIIKLTIDEKNH